MFSPYNTNQAQPAKRRVFFSFHYQDVWKVNQVRQSWRRNYEISRESEGFYDASLWESKKLIGPDSLKALIRDGMTNTSVTCVLVGSQTYSRRWVRYEIARSIIKNNGLLAVRINRMGDQQRRESPEGPNPLDYMAVYGDNGGIFLAEASDGKWVKYADYQLAVELPQNWRHPGYMNPIKLSAYTSLYCYRSHSGSENFSSWVHLAAQSVGR